MDSYEQDLAYIHDAGFGDHCRRAAPWLLGMLGPGRGLVADLGCGSGLWAQILTQRGYGVLGVDRSAAFLRMARRHAPRAKFVRASLWEAELPRVRAVTALGECLNYADGDGQDLSRLFARIHAALEPGGVLVFDIAGLWRIPEDSPRRSWTEGDDWAVLVETSGDRRRAMLTRRIVSFRKVGARFRRSEEVHRLRLYEPARVLAALRRAGFEAQVLSGYGRYRLPKGLTVYCARKRAVVDIHRAGEYPDPQARRLTRI